MFQAFAASTADKPRREHWIRTSERTQLLLDAAWDAAETNVELGMQATR